MKSFFGLILLILDIALIIYFSKKSKKILCTIFVFLLFPIFYLSLFWYIDSYVIYKYTTLSSVIDYVGLSYDKDNNIYWKDNLTFEIDKSNGFNYHYVLKDSGNVNFDYHEKIIWLYFGFISGSLEKILPYLEDYSKVHETDAIIIVNRENVRFKMSYFYYSKSFVYEIDEENPNYYEERKYEFHINDVKFNEERDKIIFKAFFNGYSMDSFDRYTDEEGIHYKYKYY